MITVDVANAIFVLCITVGGILLLASFLLEDAVDRWLDSIRLGFAVRGVPLISLLLGFVFAFGIGGLVGTQLLKLSVGPSSAVGIVVGLIGAAATWALFSFVRRPEPAQMNLDQMVGHRARATDAIVPGSNGSVQLVRAGDTHDLPATAEVEISAGSVVVITDVAGSTLVVAPATQQHTQDAP